MNKLRLGILALGLSAGLAFAAAEIGKPAPDFSAKDIHGKTHRLSDYKGKIVVLEAYNLDCPFCANHYKTGAMQELQAELASKGVVWLLVNSSSSSSGSRRTSEDARSEWTKHRIQATAWLEDADGRIGRMFAMKTTPHMYVIDKSGVLAYEGAIDDKPSAEGDPRKAKNYVRAAVQNLEQGKPVETARTKPYGCGVKYGS